VDAKAGKAQAPHLARVDIVGAVVECLGIEADLANVPAVQLIDPDRPDEVLPEMKES